jgi:hypothetical protein
MKRIIAGFTVAVLFVALTGGLVSADNNKLYYVCNCKDDCTCNTISGKPGKCTCGSALAAMHVLAIEKGNGVFCRCGSECTCVRSKTDPAKCGCGKAVKMVSLKGKYVCDCGTTCDCGTISDKPGKCHCGGSNFQSGNSSPIWISK